MGLAATLNWVGSTNIAEGGDILADVLKDQDRIYVGLVESVMGIGECMILSLVLSRSSSFNRIISERAQHVPPGFSYHH